MGGLPAGLPVEPPSVAATSTVDLGVSLGTVLYISARAFPSSTLVPLHMGRLVNPDV